MNPSKTFSINWSDFWPILTNAMLVGAAAIIAYLIENIQKLDFGSATALLVPVVVVVLNSLLRFVKDNTKVAKKT